MAEKYSCEKCGGNLKYNPETRSLICVHCLTKKAIKNEMAPQKKLIEQKNENDNKVSILKTLHCSNCGAFISVNNSEYSAVCPYCDSALVETKRDFTMPEAIIPFGITKEQAVESLYNTFKQKLFIPKGLKKRFDIEEIKDIYVPTFSFDAVTSSVYRGVLATTTSETDKNGNRRSVTHYRHISGTENLTFQNVNIECSSQITQRELFFVGGYDYGELMSFKQEYILGYRVEQNDKSIEQCQSEAQEVMKDTAKRTILRRYNYSYVSSFQMETTFTGEMYQRSLLPMYIVSYEYKGEKKKLYINGQTGRVGGHFPRNIAKILLIILLPISIFILMFIIFALITINIQIQ